MQLSLARSGSSQFRVSSSLGALASQLQGPWVPTAPPSLYLRNDCRYFCNGREGALMRAAAAEPRWLSNVYSGWGGAVRCFAGGKQKGGETAKEKKLRRLLRKINPDAANMGEHAGEVDDDSRDCQYQRQQRRKGAEREGRAAAGLEGFEAEAEAARQQMENQLQHLAGKLKEMQISRPHVEVFEQIQVHVGGSTKRLGELAQVLIRGNSFVRLTIFNDQHLSKVVSALRQTDERWSITEEGPTIVRVQLPKMTEELRSSFVSQAKAAAEGCKVQVRRVRQDFRSKLHSVCSQTKGADESLKREKEQQLQHMTDDAVRRANQLLNDKLKQLAASPT
ncbi:uncharacterized protein LOC34623222 [Cyclospora cayetanensis]|uniref:Uncharacterized protein LOC34623222 n=1 Tax=Cyclospora cayetanensis TaxID=88456 RepID=A0A6P5WE38_9EIME|nr:uncharacterized protein LOC34623222 [Cyclospora cayetanensis]